jgi:hypothetical protein
MKFALPLKLPRFNGDIDGQCKIPEICLQIVPPPVSKFHSGGQ